MNKTFLTVMLLLGLTLCEILSNSQAYNQAQNSGNNQNSNSHSEDDDQFALKYAAKYSQQGKDVISYRLSIYRANKDSYRAHNSNRDKSYEVGPNQFSDLTQLQFVNGYLGLVIPPSVSTVLMGSLTYTINKDWTSSTTAVRNQGSCGSCWAFSTLGTMEAAYKIKGSTLDLSEQQLVDCSSGYGNQGCNGGWMSSAFNYIKVNKIAIESTYPYVAKTQACKTMAGTYAISSYLQASGCSALATALALRPVSVAVDATNWSSYKTGLFNNCGTSLNHGVVVVGGNSTYWKIKNSWGASWGESGYIRLKPNNTCGVCLYPTSVTL